MSTFPEAGAARESLSPERAAYLRKRRRRDRAILCAKLAVIVLFFALWEMLARVGVLDPFIFSQPTRLFSSLSRLVQSGELFYHVGVTTAEAVAGFVLGTVFGTLIAVLLWWNPFVAKVAEPYLVVLNALPKIALGPIFIVWLGAGPTAIVVITLAISIVVSILEVLNGFLATDMGMIRLAETFGASKGQVLRKVVLPANFDTILNSLKVSVGMSWVGVIVGEFLVSRAGIGYLIVYGSQVFQMDLVMGSVLILAVIAALMYLVVLWLGRIGRRLQRSDAKAKGEGRGDSLE